MQRRLLTISIDTECDHRTDWSRSDPLSFRNITEGIPNRLQPVFEGSGAVPTYLLTVEVMEDEVSIDAIRSIHNTPHELGTHLHAAFIEPEKKHENYAGIDSPDFQCFYEPGVEFRKLENLTRLFESRFGIAPRSFRAGRYGAGPNTIQSLGKLGYLVDTSVTPGCRWQEPKGRIDFRKAPLQPYIPHARDISIPVGNADHDVVEVPISMKPRWARGPKWFRPWFSDVATMRNIATYHMKTYSKEPVIVLNMMFHSMEVIPKASPYPQSEADVRKFLEDLKKILDWMISNGFEPVGLADLHAVFMAEFRNAA